MHHILVATGHVWGSAVISAESYRHALPAGDVPKKIGDLEICSSSFGGGPNGENEEWAMFAGDTSGIN